MTTPLTKEVAREVTLKGFGTFIVTLVPGGLLRFREKGKHSFKEVPLISCERLATIRGSYRAP